MLKVEHLREALSLSERLRDLERLTPLFEAGDIFVTIEAKHLDRAGRPTTWQYDSAKWSLGLKAEVSAALLREKAEITAKLISMEVAPYDHDQLAIIRQLLDA